MQTEAPVDKSFLQSDYKTILLQARNSKAHNHSRKTKGRSSSLTIFITLH